MRLLASVGLLLALIAPLAPASAEDGVLARGDAVVTGFSGIRPADAPLKPGANPLDEFFIDLNGPAAQILSLAAPGGAPSGQLISAPAKLRIKASQIGQVFATVLDDGQGGKVPNIYLGATSAYGLNIVVPDADGDGWPERVKTGQPGAQWMSGQFGLDLGGGPGSIYKVDGQTGAVSLFATLLDNNGPGVGDIAFDKASGQFFASDLDRGLIYRLGKNGDVIDSFDHGVNGRPAKGLAPIPDDGSQAEIGKAGFGSANPQSWGYTQEERRVHGLAVQDGRLYYAVSGQIWSIGIAAEGFAKDARWELNVEALPGTGPVTDMLFDKQGQLYLAQRGAQRAAYDYSLFAEPEKSAVARYRREEPDNPATDSVWVAEPESYAIGLPPEHTHAEGGIALGYSHDETGALRYGTCGEMLWSTGHRLRQSAVAQGGEGEGEADVHGLQGKAISLVRPENVPPRQSYFADYDGFFGDAAKAGHMGDVETWQPCEGVSTPQFGSLPPGIYPPGDIPPDLPPEYIPEDEFNTNLKLVKRADPKTCLPWAGGWLCRYRIRVTNTGPDNYFGPIMVDDWLPANPPGAVIGFAPTPPWACWNTGPSAYRCLRFGVFLAPSGSIDLTAYAWVPKIKGLCNLRNVAAIKWAPGGSQWNSDPTDDEDDANALIPDPDCKPGEKTDLKIYKRALLPCFPIAGDKVRCGYRVTVENQGPGAYNGDIKVDDTIPAGTTPIFSGPGWACAVAVPTSTCTYAGASLPNIGDTVSFTVRIDMPRERARQLHCKVLNEVAITEAAGGTPQNTDATNDTATAVADVPDAVCLKPLKSNLRITKKASPTYCSRSGNDWWCSYAIRVWNMGPAKYEGPIEVEEALPGQPADASWNAPWNCAGLGGGGGGAICTHPNAIGLQPFAWRSLYLKVKFSGDLVKEKNCLLPNVAKITKAEPGTDQNTNPGDDIAGDTAKVPAWFCHQPPPEPTDLRLTKFEAQAVGCNVEGGKWRCPWIIEVRNVGNAAYNGKIVVKDWLPPAASGATMVEKGGVWNCTGDAPTITCTHPVTQISPNHQVYLSVDVFVDPNSYNGCSLTNTAKILDPLGGTVPNTNAGNDQASSALNFQPLLANGKTYCYSPEPSTPCPPGFRWGGQSCDRIGITIPPPIRTCPPGSVGKYPDCEPGTDDDPDCPRGMIGEYPNCRQPDPKCPPGSVGKYPDCRDKPDDSTPECTNGRVHRGSTCVCPSNLVWNGDQCVRRKCPEGMRGTFPNCTKVIIDPPKCGKGTTGRWPNCEKIVKICPAGTVGKYPNCRKIPKHCPSGMIGTPPRCRPIVRPCPNGTYGRPPHCSPAKKQQLQKFQRPSFGQGPRERLNGNGRR